ncbi:MAG: hypothetical protein ASARMPRED_004166 [Alectoria sarmentosa]|nr:MAG: hypothetical protein ASARMPRED_004166 [Alectoria sarmentosa]
MDTESNAAIKVEVCDVDLEDGQDSGAKPARRALSDGSRDDTPSLTYKHKWSVQQRLTLTVLGDSYANNWKEKTAVFNHFHRADFARVGGLRRAVVNTQYNDMRKYFNASDALKKLQTILSPYERSKLASRPLLERKALDIGIQLDAKGPTDSSNRSRMSDKPLDAGRKRKRADLIEDARTDFLSDHEIQTGSHLPTVYSLTFLPKTPTKPNGKQQNKGLLTPPDSRERKTIRLTADKRLAQIGFRAFTTQSQGTYSSVQGIRVFISMFVSFTKNPIRAIHMALRGGEDSTIAIIDLREADHGTDNVEKVHHLKLRTEFNYTGAGEYLIFGGVAPKAIISHLPLSRLLANIPTTPNSDDPFNLRVLRATEKLSHARCAIRKEVLPMTYSLGRAVGELVAKLCIPPKHFQSGVWSIVQDYKFYNAEGGKKRGDWLDNVAFRDGALQGYQAVRPGTSAGLEIEDNIIKSARKKKSVSDQATKSDSDSSDEDGPIPVEVEDWVRNAQSNQPSLQYFDLEKSQCMSHEEDVSEDFLAELRDVVGILDGNGSKIDGDALMENPEDVSRGGHEDRDRASDPDFGGLEMDIDSAVPARNDLEEFEDVNELCADVMRMHGDEAVSSVQGGDIMDLDYKFSWTGM